MNLNQAINPQPRSASSSTPTGCPGTDHGDLMSRLLAARDDEDHGMSDTEIADQIAVLMLAGGETTSAAVTWAWHLLTSHPEILRAVQAETDAVLGGDVAGWDHLPRLDLTARVVREALRLYLPPGSSHAPARARSPWPAEPSRPAACLSSALTSRTAAQTSTRTHLLRPHPLANPGRGTPGLLCQPARGACLVDLGGSFRV